MTYYPTIDDDLARAREILAEGREAGYIPPNNDPALVGLPVGRIGTIHGKDIYAAYQLLASFVHYIEETQRTYRIDGEAITCLLCGATSHAIGDRVQGYCGACHLFHHTVMEARAAVRRGGTHDCGEWPTAAGRCALCGRVLRDPPAPTARAGARFQVLLTESQRMALLDVIVHAMTGPATVQVYVDVLRKVETRPSDLLDLVMNAEVITP